MGKYFNIPYLIYVEDGEIKRQKWKTKRFTSEGYTIYENLQYKLAKLDKCSTLLFHFLCERMDQSNNIVHTKKLRNEFIAHADKNLGLDFKDDTVKKAFFKLVKVLLIINYDIKIDFTVNPRHVFKGSEDRRKKIILGIINSQKKSMNTKSNYKMALGLV